MVILLFPRHIPPVESLFSSKTFQYIKADKYQNRFCDIMGSRHLATLELSVKILVRKSGCVGFGTASSTLTGCIS